MINMQPKLAAEEFFRTLESYQTSPLHYLVNTATECKISSVILKDERERMNVGSFKGLGGVYAVAHLIKEYSELILDKTIAFDDLNSDEVREIASQMTFCCASAGNHGISVATGAKLFNAKCIIFLSRSVPDSFRHKLTSIGAEVKIEGDLYEDSIAAATSFCDAGEATLVSDQSWEGYTRIPQLISDGYGLIGKELAEQFLKPNLNDLSSMCNLSNESSQLWPTHVFIQAGVGGLVAGVGSYIMKYWPFKPIIVVVEPDAAPCLKYSWVEEKPALVNGPVSNMGRLDCKQASLLAYQFISKHDLKYITISDKDASDSVSYLDQKNIRTTPSGACGLAGLFKVTNDDVLRKYLKVNEDSRCLVLITEQSECKTKDYC